MHADVGVHAVDGAPVDAKRCQQPRVGAHAREIGDDGAVGEEDGTARVPALDGAVEVVPVVHPADVGGRTLRLRGGSPRRIHGKLPQQREGAIQHAARGAARDQQRPLVVIRNPEFVRPERPGRHDGGAGRSKRRHGCQRDAPARPGCVTTTGATPGQPLEARASSSPAVTSTGSVPEHDDLSRDRRGQGRLSPRPARSEATRGRAPRGRGRVAEWTGRSPRPCRRRRAAGARRENYRPTSMVNPPGASK